MFLINLKYLYHIIVLYFKSLFEYVELGVHHTMRVLFPSYTEPDNDFWYRVTRRIMVKLTTEVYARTPVSSAGDLHDLLTTTYLHSRTRHYTWRTETTDCEFFFLFFSPQIFPGYNNYLFYRHDGDDAAIHRFLIKYCIMVFLSFSFSRHTIINILCIIFFLCYALYDSSR